MVSGDALKAALIVEAKSSGFSDIGFAPARVLEDDIARLEQWLEEGRHGAMEWMADRPRRRGSVSPWVRTVIALAVAFPPLEWKPGEKKYAAYAEGHDYHKTLTQQMSRLANLIRVNGGRAKRLVDTEALFERARAREAGIGFIGRNMMLISRYHGPNVYLSLLLTDLELPQDEPGTGTCGECVRCLEACPTGALDEHGVDARKCVSYLTIELNRSLTAAEQGMAGDWTFGCDDCVTVCPYTVRGLPPIRPVARGVLRFGK